MGSRRSGFYGSLVILVLGVLVAAIGCTSVPSTSTPAPTPSLSSSPSAAASGSSFAGDIQPIFNANCVICHQGATGPVGLSLESNAAYKNLVNVKSTESPLMRVAPGAPDRSYLTNKLLGTQVQVGGSGAQMPFRAAPLLQSQISLIQQWILQGALNN